MQHYSHDPLEREPLDSSRSPYNSPSRPPPVPAHGYSQPYYDAPPPRAHHPSAHPDSNYNRMSGHDAYSHSDRSLESSGDHGGPPHYDDHAYYNNNSRGGIAGGESGYARLPPSSTITPGADNFSDSASGGMAGIAYNVADRNPRNSGMDALHGDVPPPPSRTQNGYSPQSSGYESYGNNTPEDSHTNLTGVTAAAAVPMGGRGHARDPYLDNPYQGISARHSAHLGIVNPNEIEDDGDDGLDYGQGSQRNSMLSLPHSARGNKQAIGTAAAVGAAVGGGGLLRKGYGGANNGEKSSDWLNGQRKNTKRWKWAIIILVFIIVVGAIVGGVVGGTLNNKKQKGGSSSSDSASDDEKQNGDLDKNSSEIKALMNNTDLHRVFPGIDYTPINTQYPACLENPPSQNNVTRDMAVLTQLTNKIRLYGTDCNQTEMVLHAIDRLELTDVKVWLGVWQDGNDTTNARQLSQMWDILDNYGDDPFEGIIVANEIIYREEMTVNQLGTLLDDVRKNLTSKKLDLPVATSDLGDDWTSALAADSDYIMANIHPFFAGVTAEEAAAWTWNFWSNNDGTFWKTDKSKNIISETGWPSQGGKDCGGATSCTNGSVAGIDELNTFMEGWVCQALENGTQYFWFEAFDEPWKITYDTPGKEWEDHWGLLTVDRVLKDGVKIPDCDGKTVS